MILKNLNNKARDFGPEAELVTRTAQKAGQFKNDANNKTHSKYHIVKNKKELDDKEPQEVIELIKKLDASISNPIIVTIRNKKEGGKKAINDNTRYEILKNIVRYVDCVDIEINSNLFKKIPSFFHSKKKTVIASYHNFKETPSNAKLKNILAKGKKGGADIVKIAVMANSRDDLAKIIDFTIKNSNKNIIMIAMGNIGRISRILNPMLGSLLTYGYVINPSAAGQPSANEIINQLRYFDPEYNKLFNK